jgi:AraC family transcriptional regulator of arabinose operon
MRIDEKTQYIHFLDEKLWVKNGINYRSEEITPLYIDRYNGPRVNPNMDFHSHWEFLIVFRGSGKIHSLDSIFKLGESYACLVPPNIKHAELSDEPMDALWVGLRGSLLNKINSTMIQISSGDEIKKYAEELWLRNMNHFEMIGPELDGLTQALVGSSLKLTTISKNNSYGYIEDTLLFINKNYMKNITIGLLSSRIGYSESYFYRSFKINTGQTPIEYITNVRIQIASRLLKSSSLSVKEISKMVGYDDPLYFSRLFKRITKYNPREYR